MILEKLCDLARREGLLSNPDYEPKPVAKVVAIGDAGRFIDIVPTAVADERTKKLRAKTLSIPRRSGRTSSPSADFLVDKSEYVLGIEPDGKRSPDDLKLRRKLFRTSVQAAATATNSRELSAVADFLGNETEITKAGDCVSAQGYASNDLFAFEYRGRLVHDLAEVQNYFSRSRRTSSADGAQCLICGATSAPVDKHPLVKVPGGTTSGVALVSFNSGAFESYGLSRNENAPFCRNCADGYTTALNRLLSDRYPDPRHEGETLPRRFVRLSPETTALFWGDDEADVIDLMANFFDTPRAETVAELLEAPYKGRMPSSPLSRFYCLILSGEQGRAIVRGMHADTITHLQQNLRQYFESIGIGSDEPLPLRRMMDSLLLPGKKSILPPSLVTDVFLAILFNRLFPQTLLARAVGRCKAERKVPRERAALMKAYSIRNLRLEVTVGLDAENTSPGYRLGRLMAVLERIQAIAQKNPNKTIVDRYYGAASTRPGTVFPRLIALAQHHLSKLKGGTEVVFQKLLGEVVSGITPPFSATLSLEQQGLFALGYYHQRQEFFKRAETATESIDVAGEEI